MERLHHLSTVDSVARSTVASETVEVVSQPVAGDSVSLSVALEAVTCLPEGAEYSRKSGRTRVTLRRDGGNVVAEAVSDSLAREVRRWERKARDSLCQRVGTALRCEREDRVIPVDGKRAALRIAVAAVAVLLLLKLAFRR